MRLEADVLIPVYRPGNRLEILLEQLHTQTCPARKIILMNTEKQYFPAGLEENMKTLRFIISAKRNLITVEPGIAESGCLRRMW